MIRVLHLINNLAREGAQVVVYNLVSYPGSGEFEHIVFSREPNGQLQPALAQRGIKVFAPDYYYGIVQTRRSVAFIQRVVEEEGIDLIHAHMGDAAFLGWLVARKKGQPLLISHHGHDVLPVCGSLCRAIYSLLIKWAAHYARWNIAVSESVAGQVREKLKVAEDKVCFIGNGVPVPSEQMLAKDGDKNSNPLKIMTVGRLVDLKGQDQFINVAAALVEHYPDARFYLIGDGPLRSSLEQQAVELGVADKVVFAGVVEDVASCLRKADVYISTSHSEGLSMAILEAMAWDVPVITSDIPGNRSVVTHEETGLLYPLGDIDALKAAILNVVNQPEAAATRCQKARQMVIDFYSVDATIQAHERLYASVL